MTRRDPRRSPRRLLLLAVAVIALAGLGFGAALNGTLVYARTPDQVLAGSGSQHVVRLEGTVVPGTLHHSAEQVRFDLRDPTGAGRTVAVEASGAPPEALREGAEAVVEGTLRTAPGAPVFVATRVIPKHGNEYRAAGSGS